jgi:hypothetical protein
MYTPIPLGICSTELFSVNNKIGITHGNKVIRTELTVTLSLKNESSRRLMVEQGSDITIQWHVTRVRLDDSFL